LDSKEFFGVTNNSYFFPKFPHPTFYHLKYIGYRKAEYIIKEFMAQQSRTEKVEGVMVCSWLVHYTIQWNYSLIRRHQLQKPSLYGVIVHVPENVL